MAWKEIGSAPGLENTVEKARGVAQLVECLPRMHKVLSFILSTAQNWLRCCNPSTLAEESGRSRSVSFSATF